MFNPVYVPIKFALRLPLRVRLSLNRALKQCQCSFQETWGFRSSWFPQDLSLPHINILNTHTSILSCRQYFNGVEYALLLLV